MQLLFGVHEVAIIMPAFEGASCTDTEVTENGPFVHQVAEAVAWLAFELGVIYTDIRGPNVINHNGHARLVDYDDCIVVESKTVTSIEAFKHVLDSIPRSSAILQPTFADQFLQGAFPTLENAIGESLAGLMAALSTHQ